MGHDHHRHDHDKGLKAKLHWLLLIGKFWRSDVNAHAVALADPQPGDRALDIGAGMGPASVDAARRGAVVTAVDPSAFMRFFCGLRRFGRRARGRITVVDGGAAALPGSSELPFPSQVRIGGLAPPQPLQKNNRRPSRRDTLKN